MELKDVLKLVYSEINDNLPDRLSPTRKATFFLLKNYDFRILLFITSIIIDIKNNKGILKFYDALFEKIPLIPFKPQDVLDQFEKLTKTEWDKAGKITVDGVYLDSSTKADGEEFVRIVSEHRLRNDFLYEPTLSRKKPISIKKLCNDYFKVNTKCEWFGKDLKNKKHKAVVWLFPRKDFEMLKEWLLKMNYPESSYMRHYVGCWYKPITKDEIKRKSTDPIKIQAETAKTTWLNINYSKKFPEYVVQPNTSCGTWDYDHPLYTSFKKYDSHGRVNNDSLESDEMKNKFGSLAKEKVHGFTTYIDRNFHADILRDLATYDNRDYRVNDKKVPFVIIEATNRL